MKRNIKIAPLGIGLAITASLFAVPIFSAHADGFDGKAYLVWDCGKANGMPCYHLFEDINTDNTYTVYSDASVEDETDNTIKFSAKNVDTNKTTFALKAPFDAYKAAHATFTIQDVMDAEYGEEHNRLALNPLEAPIEANAYTHFGDRNFKVMIKSPDYVGVTIKNATSSYEPDFGTALNSTTYHDLTGTTATKPLILYAIPQQTEVILTSDAGPFDSVAALDVPTTAVTITGSEAGHTIKFNSNYYDQIIFRVTKGSNTYYVQIFRTAIQTQKADVSPMKKDVNVIAYFDVSKTCNSYEISAKLVYKNGNNKTIKLSPAAKHDDGYGNEIQGCLADGGTNLKKGYYTGEADVNLMELDGIYITIINAGTTASFYAGTISGSNKGIYINLAETPMTNQAKWGKVTPKEN